MDNKQDRQFYWEVKQFMGKTPDLASQEKQTSPSLVENIKNVLNKNELYRPSSFNPSISSPNTINQAIGAMEQSKRLGASNSAEHTNNVYGNAFANPPKNLNEADDWNWREHSREENIAHGRQEENKRKEKYKKNTEEIAQAHPGFYKQQLRDKAEGISRAENELAAAAPNKRISPAYWVTHADFEKATGEKYDPRNAKHRQLFFDLNSSGESTVSPTAGVGQGPAYDSVAYHTMRRRPANIPPRYIDVDGKKVANPQARYDTVDGTIANTTPQSRAKAQWDADDAAALKRIDAEAAKRDAEIRAEAKRIVDAEQEKSARQNYIDQIQDTVTNDGSRTIVAPGKEERGLGIDVEHGQFPIYPEGQSDSHYRAHEAPGSAVSNVVNALISGAGKSAIEKGKELGSTMKKSLMQTVPMQGQPAGGADPDIQRGQHPIYPEGQEDSAYKKPAEAPGSAVSDIINNLVKSVGNSGKNVADELQRLMKLNAAQTTPNVIKDKLYGDAAVGGAQFDTQQKTPPMSQDEQDYEKRSRTGEYAAAPYDPSVVSEIEYPEDVKIDKSQEEKVPQSSADFVKDVVKPLKDAAEEQSAQEKINDILKNLGTPNTTKTTKRIKRKRKATSGLAMMGEGVVAPPPFTTFQKAKDLAKDVGKATTTTLGHLAYGMPGFYVGSHGIAEPIAKAVGASEEPLIPNEYIGTSEKDLVYDWPISTMVGAATAPMVKQLVTSIPRAIGSGVAASQAFTAGGAAAAAESAGALAGLASPIGLAITLGPAVAYGLGKLGEKAIKSYYDVNDKDYEAAQKEQEKYDQEMEKRGAGTNERIGDTNRYTEKEKQALLATPDTSDNDINAAIKASRARKSPNK